MKPSPRLPAPRHELPGIAVLLLAAAALPAYGQEGDGGPPVPTFTEEEKLPVFGVFGTGSFGSAVDVSGEWAIAGAPSNEGGPGSAFVFRRTPAGWVQDAELSADGDTWLFGSSVSIDGGLAVVGAPGEDDDFANSGAAYVFERTGGGWVQQARLVASDGQGGDGLGISVAIDGETVVAGAEYGDGAATDSGCAYVFERQGGTWVEAAKLFALDAPGLSSFGYSVAVSGDRALVGAPMYNPSPFPLGVGGAFVFVRTPGGWVQEAKLPQAPGGRLGWSVSLWNDRALVGAPMADSLGVDSSGAAIAFERTPGGWVNAGTLLSLHGPVQIVQFGWAVSLEGDWAAVTTAIEDTAHVFERTASGWVGQAEALPSETEAGSFGRSVALSGLELLVGAPSDDVIGSVHAFTLPNGACASRAGALGLNPDDYDCVTEPRVGATWLAAVETAPLLGTSTAGTVLAFGMGGGTAGLAAFGFELLILPPYLPTQVSSSGSHAVLVPDVPSLVGAAFATQGARIESSPSATFAVLTNAQDLTVGLF